MRHWINLIEQTLVEYLDNTTIEQAVADVFAMDCAPGNGGYEGDMEYVLRSQGYDYDYDFNTIITPDGQKVDSKSPDGMTIAKAIFRKFIIERIHDVYGDIEWRFQNGKLPVWRVITAGPDWEPDPNRHPGIYWTWDESAAEAHWGYGKNGDTEYVLKALVNAQDINWPTTLAMNASPAYEEEKEIRIKDGVEIDYSWEKKT